MKRARYLNPGLTAACLLLASGCAFKQVGTPITDPTVSMPHLTLSRAPLGYAAIDVRLKDVRNKYGTQAIGDLNGHFNGVQFTLMGGRLKGQIDKYVTANASSSYTATFIVPVGSNYVLNAGVFSLMASESATESVYYQPQKKVGEGATPINVAVGMAPVTIVIDTVGDVMLDSAQFNVFTSTGSTIPDFVLGDSTAKAFMPLTTAKAGSYQIFETIFNQANQQVLTHQNVTGQLTATGSSAVPLALPNASGSYKAVFELSETLASGSATHSTIAQQFTVSDPANLSVDLQ